MICWSSGSTLHDNISIIYLLLVQMVIQIVVLAFVVVGGTCGLLIPVLLYIFNLHTEGWNWPYAALLGAMLASTDAVAIVAVMKTSTQSLAIHRQRT